LKIPESQEICFIQTTINDFLKKYLKEKPGKIITKEGKIVGEHRGLWFYTIGQRKGIKLSGGSAFAVPSPKRLWRVGDKAWAGKPYYVLDKDLKRNLLIVTLNEKDYNLPTTSSRLLRSRAPTLYKKELIAKNVNWISGKIPKILLKIKAKIRYRHQSAPAIITKTLNPKTYHLKFSKPQRAITPGQSVVFYKGEELLGGGIIC